MRQQNPLLIEIDKLRLAIGRVVVLHDVRMSLSDGQIYGLLGPNGAGKSTMIAAALGLRAPDAGTARLLGLDPQRLIGFASMHGPRRAPIAPSCFPVHDGSRVKANTR